MRICPACKFENVDNAKFCEKCGAKLDDITAEAEFVICPTCATKNKKGAKFCEKCGAKLNADQKIKEDTQNVVRKKEKKKRLSRLHKIIILEILGIVVTVVLFFGIGNMKYSAENIAEKYFEAYSNHDWNTMYSLLELPEGSFMKESQFAELMEKEEVPSLSNYTIRSTRQSEASMMQEFEIKYSASGEGATTMDLTLVCDDDKELLFFDKWRVSSENVLSNSYQISVPHGSKVAVDGVELAEEFLVGKNDNGKDTYEISVFEGNHDISVAAPWCELFVDEFNTINGDFLDLTKFELTENGEKALQVKMQQGLELFLSSAISGSDYDAVKKIFSSDVADDYEEEYQDLVEKFKKEPDDRNMLNKITFNNFQYEISRDQKTNLWSGELSGEYVIDYTYTTSDSTENETRDGNAKMVATFVYEDDTYKIQSISLPYISW